LELAIQIGEVASKLAQCDPDIKIRDAVKGEQLQQGEKITEIVTVGMPEEALGWGSRFKFFDLKKRISVVITT
jgi:ATP-dependent RNA helicase DDX19/DBP5